MIEENSTVTADANSASFMLQAIFDRQRELESKPHDPFFLLKEVAEMSNLKNLSKNDAELTTAQ